MALSIPVISGVSPAVNDTDVQLRPVIQVIFGGAQLIDPLTWDNRTFALYGPGDVVLDAGPGTILNSGMSDAPYPILDGPLRRDRVEGDFNLFISGTSGLDTAESIIGSGQPYVIGRFIPSVPLNPNTTYVVVILGDDGSVFVNDNERRFGGVTSYTSPSGFISTAPPTSGFIQVVRPYSRTLETSVYDATTGFNDTYTITITSGSGPYGFKYEWNKLSSPGNFNAIVSGTTDVHDLGDGLRINFQGTFALGEIYELNTYIPQPLPSSTVWSFSTGDVLQYDTPPEEPPCISLIIDNTDDGGLVVDTTTDATSGTQFYVVGSDPANLDYDIDPNLGFIELEFNENILSGVYDVSNVEVTTTPILGISGSITPVTIVPTRLETSGKFLRIILS